MFLLSAPSVAFCAPSLFWISDPVYPGESALAVGDGFKDGISVAIRQRGNDLNEKDGSIHKWGSWTEVEPLQASGNSVKFVIPTTFTKGMYELRIGKGNDIVTGTINEPAIYWVQGDAGGSAFPSGWIRLVGKCLNVTGVSPVLSLVSADGAREKTLSAVRASLWDAQFSVPSDMAPGKYVLRYGQVVQGSRSWTTAGEIEIVGHTAESKRTFNVKNYGARGDGTVDDTSTIRMAIQDVRNNGGGIVYFPRGRYMVTDTIFIPQDVSLQGERRDLVNLFWPDREAPLQHLLYGYNHFAVSDMTIYASNHGHVIASDLTKTDKGKPGNVRIERVTIRANAYRGHLKPEQVDSRFREGLKASSGGYDTIRLGGENIILADSDVYGSGRALFLFKPKNAYGARNKLYNGRWGWYVITGSDGVIFEENEVAGSDLMSTGGGINNLGDVAASRNVLFARNKFALMHGWDREAVTSDAGGGYYYGSVRSLSNSVLELLGEPVAMQEARNGWKGAGVFILGGKGMGQFGQVEKLEGKKVYLDRPWKEQPDEKSIITITMMQQNYIFTDNEFVDAGIGIQFYGTSVGHIMSGNKSTRTGGFLASGRWYRHYQPSWYCQFLDNEIIEGNTYRSGSNNAIQSGEAVIGVYGFQKEPNTAPLSIGTVVRRNHLHSNSHIEVIGVSKKSPGIRDVIVENNIIENADRGIVIDEGSKDTLFRGNIFKNIRDYDPPAGSGIIHYY